MLEHAQTNQPYNSKKQVKAPIGKRPPHTSEIEQSLLGAILLEKEALANVIEMLRPESFYKGAHQEIYRAILSLFHKNDDIDLYTVIAELKKQGTFEQVGGAAYLAQLTHNIASAAHIENHARIITEYAMRRGLIQLASHALEGAYDETIDTFQLIDRSEQELFEIAETHIRKNYERIDDLIGHAIQEIQKRQENKEEFIGIPTGFPTLDQILLGLHPADFIVIAARPGMGKTSFLLSLLRNAAVDHQKPVAFFSLEMSSAQVTQRMICSDAEISAEQIKKGNLPPHQMQQILSKTQQLAQAPIYIDDTPALSLFELRAKCRRLKARHDIQIIAIDYLQLMRGEGGNREQEVAHISRGLKSIAKELNIPVIAAAQLSRAVETRGGDKVPQLSDLRESGSIEQDVDIALMLYRWEYYGITETEEGMNARNLAKIKVAKHRNGALGDAIVKYNAAYTRFEPADLTFMGDEEELPFGQDTYRESKLNTPFSFNN